MKKLYALLLVLLLAFGLSVTAQAAAPKQLHLEDLAEMDESATFSMEQLLALLQEAYDLGYEDGKSAGTVFTPASNTKRSFSAMVSPSADAGATIDYVLNTNTHKFHYPDCSSVDTIKPGNREDYSGSREAVIARGFEPCKKCKP